MGQSSWICAIFALTAACASGESSRTMKLGTVVMPHSHFLVTAALTLTQRVCEDPHVRNCLSVADAECVRTVGDKLINAGPFDMHEMSVPEQQKWLHDAEPLLIAALKPYDDGKAAGKACRDAQFHLGSLEARSGERHGPLCVRMANDKTPCSSVER